MEFATLETDELVTASFPIHLSGQARQMLTLIEALETIAEHAHPGRCDGVCADNMRETALEALEAAQSQQAPE